MTVTASSTVYNSVGSTGASSTVSSANAEASDRFLKLLVAQMNNQDPLNPLDNAQVTSQMAQINTVNGIEKLNETVSSMMGSFMSLQALQGANLVGRSVMVPGDKMTLADGAARGGFSIEQSADAAKLEIISSTGGVVDSIELGKQDVGTHRFEWDGKKADGTQLPDGVYRVRVTATQGGKDIEATTLVGAKVQSVVGTATGLQVELQGMGTVNYDQISSIF